MQTWDHVPAWAAEFPNDNPALHEGVSWVCLAVCGPAKPVARPRPAVRPLGVSAPVPYAAVHPTRAVVAPTPEVARVEAALPAVTAELEALPEVAVAPPQTSTPPPAEIPSFLAAPEAPPMELSEAGRLPPSVLGVLLERLDFELTPTDEGVSGSPLPHDALEVLDIDASDLDPDSMSPGPTALVLEEASSEPFVFDGSIDSGASETNAGEVIAEEVVGAALGRPEHPENVAASESDEGPPGAETPAGQETGAESEKAAPFRAFVAALVEVLLVSGSTRAAAVLPRLLESCEGGLAAALDAESRQALVAARIAEELDDASICLSPAFTATARAWRDVLSGETQNLSACGTSTLDGWAGDLLKALGVGREGKMDVRRELRRRGVAAFGMLLAA
jgi:hypothetical protein